ncbi:hypothetical protein MNKW57_03280 [Biformimicrobium ophioploci]|uniref:SURF1-like protein n=2 Tax=Biformimicrobium ophioploci TaxID=3036711 RepID=A0ABQ6LVF3_9GAMM|nr:hypothetical protein MNKW57_03280 [Microbulbifer sp. NKW57]
MISPASARSEKSAAQPPTSLALIRNWPVTVFSWLLLPVLVSLGLWQLDRAAQKARQLHAVDTRLAQQPQHIAQLRDWQPYVPVVLEGNFTDETLYLDNRTRGGRAGYEILQVFVVDGRRWLVNRGWVAAGRARGQVPAISTPQGQVRLTGFTDSVPDRAADPLDADRRLTLLGRDLTGSLGLHRADWLIRLSADSIGAMVTDWNLTRVSPDKHRGYAFQWFAMAAVLLLLWLYTATSLRDLLRRATR